MAQDAAARHHALPRLRVLATAVALGMTLGPRPALAGSDASDGLSAGLRAGTLGTGAEVTYQPPGSKLGIRLGADGLAGGMGGLFARRVDETQGPFAIDGRLSYGGRARLLTGHLVGDWHPLDVLPGLRLSAGLYGNADRLVTTMHPTGTVQAGPLTLPAAGAVLGRGTATWNPVDPYVGVGYEAPLGGGLSLTAEAGAFYEGHPHTTASVSGPGAALPIVQGLMQQERRRVASRIDLPFYPVVELGIAYGF